MWPKTDELMTGKSGLRIPLANRLSLADQLRLPIRVTISIAVQAAQTQLARSIAVGVALLVLTFSAGSVNAQVLSLPEKTPNTIAVGAESDIPVQQPVEVGKAELPANRIRGTVFLANGNPAAECKLHIAGHRTSGIDAHLTTDSKGQFEFVVHHKPAVLGQLKFSAESADGSEMGFHRFGWSVESLQTEGIHLNLQPARIAEIEVVDADGRPIADAHVAIKLAYPHALHGFSTDAAGKANVRIPASERIESIVAWKDHAGLDYKTYQLNYVDRADNKAVVPEYPTDRPERLVLDGASPIAVTVVDSADHTPIEGVEVCPWLLQKNEETGALNFTDFVELISQATHETGTTTFAWIPSWQTSPVVFWSNAAGYECPRANYEPLKHQGAFQLALNRLVAIRGKVVDLNGRPVQGAEVSAHGKGRSFNEFRSITQTDDQGKYELEVAPNQNYILTASDQNRVSAPHAGLIVYPNLPLENRDFVLRVPTRVHGRLLNERTQEPIPNTRVIVYQYGTELTRIPEANIPNPHNERSSVLPIIQHVAITDAAGEFQFLLGDGRFAIRPPQGEKSEDFAIQGQDDLEFTVTTKISNLVELVGLVLCKADRQPIKAARVEGVPQNYVSNQWRATTDDRGKFEVQRRQEATYVRAMDEAGTLATIVDIGDLKRTYVFQLTPVGSAQGRLLDRDQHPIAGQRINYSIDLPSANEDEFMPRFGGNVTTNEFGEFELRSLVGTWEYRLSLPETPEGTIPRLTTVTVKPGEKVLLGDLMKPGP